MMPERAKRGRSTVAKAVQQEGAPEGDRAAGAAPPLDGSLALELINTEVMERGKRHDVLTTPEVLARWWAEVCELYPEQCAVEGALAPTAWTSQQLDGTSRSLTGGGSISAAMTAASCSSMTQRKAPPAAGAVRAA
jgi:hypothetical protein